MAEKSLPTPEVLRQLLRYEPETGKLFWRQRPVSMFTGGKYPAERNAAAWNSRYAEKEAFTSIDNYGYPEGAIFDRGYRAHRVIWALVHGHWTTMEIDHVNGDKADNRLSNLREASRSDNGRNKGRQANNTSGYMGVSRHRRWWLARITYNGARHELGYFKCKVAAARAYDAAAREQHGEFARLNFPNELGGDL